MGSAKGDVFQNMEDIPIRLYCIASYIQGEVKKPQTKRILKRWSNELDVTGG